MCHVIQDMTCGGTYARRGPKLRGAGIEGVPIGLAVPGLSPKWPEHRYRATRARDSIVRDSLPWVKTQGFGGVWHQIRVVVGTLVEPAFMRLLYPGWAGVMAGIVTGVVAGVGAGVVAGPVVETAHPTRPKRILGYRGNDLWLGPVGGVCGLDLWVGPMGWAYGLGLWLCG